MKRLLMYISILIIVTTLLLLFVIKNFPNDIVEICLKSDYTKDQIEAAMQQISAYDYLNIYDVFSLETNASIYFGNINILLDDKKIEQCGMTFDDKEVIMGGKFMEENFKYNLLGEKYRSSYGEYDVNCIIKGSDRIYYRDLNVLENNNIKNQRLYLVLSDYQNRLIDVNLVIDNLKYAGIYVSHRIVYYDLSRFLEKLLVILLIVLNSIVFIELLKKNKLYYKDIRVKYEVDKYNLNLKYFVLKDYNLRLILKLLFICLIQVLICFTILYLTIKFKNIYLSYSIDFTAFRSITEAVKSFVNLLKYYIINGFTDISMMIVKVIFVYILTLIISIKVSKKVNGR